MSLRCCNQVYGYSALKIFPMVFGSLSFFFLGALASGGHPNRNFQHPDDQAIQFEFFSEPQSVRWFQDAKIFNVDAFGSPNLKLKISITRGNPNRRF